MDHLIKGIANFRSNTFEDYRDLFEQLGEGQAPSALLITCADSRIDPNLITQTRPGELFICRNAGNVVPPHSPHTGGTSASIEYAVLALGVPNIIVCGHTDCGAMKGAMNPDSLEALPKVSQWLGHCAAARARVLARHADDDPSVQLAKMTEENVLLQMRHLETHPAVASRLASDQIEIHGWVYDIAKGSVRCYQPESASFVAIEDRYASLLAGRA